MEARTLVASAFRGAGRAGVSLVEVLVALAIFGVALVFLMGLFPVGADSVRQARELNVAAHLAELKLEETRAQAFASISSINGSENLEMTNNGNKQTQEYLYQVLVTDEPAVSPEIKNIVVSVSWTSETGLRTVRLETDVVNPEP